MSEFSSTYLQQVTSAESLGKRRLFRSQFDLQQIPSLLAVERDNREIKIHVKNFSELKKNQIKTVPNDSYG